jgi:tRNA (cytidine32/uridine32-2'-O)-methyltransferase
VLVNTSHPGNIGSTARAMANMGLTNLVLVDPEKFPSDQANAMAAGVDDILDNAQVFPDLAQAVEGCSQVYGISARLRSVSWPQYSPRELSEQINNSAAADQIALVFGRERSGLTNEELDVCEGLVNIPVDDMHRSLNLAAAVMVVLYEIKMGSTEPSALSVDVGKKHHSDKATSLEVQYFFQRWDNTSKSVDFYKGNPDIVMRKIRRIFYKADLSQEEVKILLGVLTAIDIDLKKIPSA